MDADWSARGALQKLHKPRASPEAQSILNGVTVRQINTCCIAAELCLQPSSLKGLGMTQARL
jgi:hypothetical protein